MSGLIDDVKIYDRARSRADCQGVPGRPQAASNRRSAAAPDAARAAPGSEVALGGALREAIPKDTIGRGPTTAAVRPTGVPAYINDNPVFPMAMIPIGHSPPTCAAIRWGGRAPLQPHHLGLAAGVVTKDPSGGSTGPVRLGKVRPSDPVDHRSRSTGLHLPSLTQRADVVGQGPSDELADPRRTAGAISLASEEWEMLYEGMLRDQIRHIEAGLRRPHHRLPTGGRRASEWYWSARRG